MLTVESTLDTADEALATLNSGLEVAEIGRAHV